MKLVIASDLHNEMRHDPRPVENPFPRIADEHEMAIIVAGDLGSIKYMQDTILPYIKDLSGRFRAVIYVPGNHEFYGSDIEMADAKLAHALRRLTNVYYSTIQGKSILLDDLQIVSHPLFSDMGGTEETKYAIECALFDFRVITINGRAITGDNYVDYFTQAQRFIGEELSRNDHKHKQVVVTHWAPSYQSVHPRFRNTSVNGGFCSEIDFDTLRPALWVHGHTHDAFDYTIKDTRIVCNPEGYRSEHGFNGYRSMKVIEV